MIWIPRWSLRRNAPVLAGLLLLIAGCTASGDSDDRGAFLDPAVPAGSLRLVSFDSCDQAAEQLRAAAREHVGPWGFGSDAQVVTDAAPEAADGAAESLRGAAPAAPAPKAPGTDQEVPEHSDTNVHEAGVDEPDLVKTDGRRIVTVAGGMLRVVDAERRVQLGSLSLGPGGYAADLLLDGDRALVLMTNEMIAYGDRAVPPDVAPEPAGPRILLVDLNGPGVISEYTMDGWLVDARAVGSTARVVVRSSPRISFPEYAPDANDKTRLEGNRKAVAAADLDDWLPRYEVSTGGETSTGQVDCTAMSRPASYSGASMLTVLTFDLAAPGLSDGAPVSVAADGDTVYSNGLSLYVATDQRWRMEPSDDPEVDPGTEIYKFDTSQPGPPTYLASGHVDGWLINQYAMSEWDGHLRVATTSGETFFGAETDSESTVYVLAEQAGQLVVTGSVGGLGKSERIHSVRFTGPIGYVVTFRQTDPLYTVDLRDPAAPAVLGELKITGYSTYLHPINDARLIGVGQEADLQGVTQGTQVSLFDVSDLSDPTLQAKHVVPHGSSEAEFDPHAFLWWPAERLLVLPLHDYYEGSSEALLLRVEETGFTELGRISHPGTAGVEGIRRSLVIGDALWTVSDSGLAAHSLTTFEQVGWVSF